jgi:hypothetical protein
MPISAYVKPVRGLGPHSLLTHSSFTGCVSNITYMTDKTLLGTVARGAIAVATSVLIGARAGAFLARKPLLVPVHQRHQPYAGRG